MLKMKDNKTPKQRREKKTLKKMIGIYCEANHQPEETLCPQCQELLNYAYDRIARCPLGMQKTTCAGCPVHCFKPGYRDKIKEVMRYAGPKMIFKHPVLALFHILDSRMKVKVK